MTKYIVDIKGEIEGDYEIIGKYEEPEVKGDLISREALKKAIKDNGYSHYFEIFSIIDNAPTVETEKIAVANVTFDKEQLEEIVEKAKAEVLAVALDANERPQGECKTCRHRDPEDKKCDCGGQERQGCKFPVSDDYFCKFYERGGAE